jgi:hypothetical protein
MDMFNAARAAALLGAAALVAACTANGDRPAALDGTPPRMSAEAEGVVPDYCPRITLREGTAILRKGDDANLQYVASIVSTSRECRVLNGELRMKVGISGRVVPGPAAKSGELGLPIRVAVVQGSNVLYSQMGSQAVSLQPGNTPTFVYVDSAIVVPEPTGKDLVIYAGFDEGSAD